MDNQPYSFKIVNGVFDSNDNKDPNGIFSASRTVNYYYFGFMKSYLYSLYRNKSDDKIKVFSFNSIENNEMGHPSLSSEKDNTIEISNPIIHSIIEFEKRTYMISLVSFKEERLMAVINYIKVTGQTSNDNNPKDVIDFIFENAVRNSVYNGKILKIEPCDSEFVTSLNSLKINIIEEEYDDLSIDDLFLANEIRDEFKKFTDCVYRYNEFKIPMRYLLCGLPGTGKTHIIRTISAILRGKATVIFLSAGDERLNVIFDLAKFFNPAVICIDDIDLIVGERTTSINNAALSRFLQELDGFVKHNNIFLIASTNDKNLIDIAARRPLRFDQIIYLPPLNPDNYSKLAEKYTSDPDIIKLFKEESIKKIPIRK